MGEQMEEKRHDAYAFVRGFNYQPSYCTTLYEMWDSFDERVWQTEIERGKNYFPKLNCIRIWMDCNPYLRDRKRFVRSFGAVLDICGKLDIQLMPTLFNRWHNFDYDFTGIYYDQLLRRDFRQFATFIRDIVTPLKNDERILMWDLCNEPQIRDRDLDSPLHQAELEWLTWVAERVRDICVAQPITIGTFWGANVEAYEPLCDVVCIHPYRGWWDDSFAKACDWAVEFAKAKGKPLIANETCQGSMSNEVRKEIIRVTLGALKERGIGWCAWHLHGGRMITANREITDGNCRPGDRSYMAFIEPDGALRPNHDVFNEF